MYIKITSDGPILYSPEQLRRDNPTTSFPRILSNDVLASFGVYPYEQDTMPAYDSSISYVAPGEFVSRDNNWFQPWDIVAYTQQELDARNANLIAQIKMEARRRILDIVPEWKQSNLTARAAELAIKGVANWTVEEYKEYDAGQAIWDAVKRIRAASNALELLNPIPTDYTAEKYWS